MGLKVYRSNTGVKYNFLLDKKNKQQVMVMFRGGNKSFQTKDTELQKLIEETRYFKDGLICLIEEVEGEKAKDVKPDEVVYSDVTEMQDAIVVLVNDFGVKETTLKTPADIKKAADRVGASFPNLKNPNLG